MGCHIWHKARLSDCFSKFESLPHTPAKESNESLVSLTRGKLGPVSNALHAINVPNPARSGRTTFEAKECYYAPYKGGFPPSDNFHVRTHVNYKRVNKLEAMY